MSAKRPRPRLHVLPQAEIQFPPVDFDEPLSDEEMALHLTLEARTALKQI